MDRFTCCSFVSINTLFGYSQVWSENPTAVEYLKTMKGIVRIDYLLITTLV